MKTLSNDALFGMGLWGTCILYGLSRHWSLGDLSEFTGGLAVFSYDLKLMMLKPKVTADTNEKLRLKSMEILDSIEMNQKNSIRDIETVLQIPHASKDRKRFERGDLRSLFNVEPSHDITYEPYLQNLMDEDGAIFKKKEQWDSETNDVVKRLIQSENDQIVNRLIHAEWIGPHYGFGTVASVNLEAGTIIDMMSGTYRVGHGFTDYGINVARLLQDDVEIVFVDNRNTGNLIRFFNFHFSDDASSGNIRVSQYYHDGKRYPVAITTRPVRRGEQLLITRTVQNNPPKSWEGNA